MPGQLYLYKHHPYRFGEYQIYGRETLSKQSIAAVFEKYGNWGLPAILMYVQFWGFSQNLPYVW